MIKNSKGFSILETMIAVGLIGIIGLGLTSLMTEMSKQQSAANTKALLASQKLKIEALIKDSRAWSASVNETANNGRNYMTCLRVPPVWGGFTDGCRPAGNSETFTQTNGTSNGLALYEAPGQLYYNSITAANGFNVRGQTCNTWPSTACPIRWDFSVTISCQSTIPCLSPTVRVIARPNIPGAQMDALRLTMNADNYQVDVTRGIGTRFDPILVTERIVTSSGNGAGVCATNPATVNRVLNTEENDPAGNVTVSGGGITFLPGSYSCRITSPAFKVGTHEIRWMNGSTVVARSTGANSSINYPTITNAIMEVSFVISTATTYRVSHTCQFSNQTPTSVQLGFATDYTTPGGSIFTTVACYRNG